MDSLTKLPSAVMLGLAVLLAVWLVLLLLVPFMIESIRNSTRKANSQLELLNERVDKLIALLDRGDAPTPSSEPLGDRVPGRARKEPTISE